MRRQTDILLGRVLDQQSGYMIYRLRTSTNLWCKTEQIVQSFCSLSLSEKEDKALMVGKGIKWDSGKEKHLQFINIVKMESILYVIIREISHELKSGED
jgi:hypothetical protein